MTQLKSPTYVLMDNFCSCFIYFPVLLLRLSFRRIQTFPTFFRCISVSAIFLIFFSLSNLIRSFQPKCELHSYTKIYIYLTNFCRPKIFKKNRLLSTNHHWICVLELWIHKGWLVVKKLVWNLFVLKLSGIQNVFLHLI